jgi:hypothetical protein
MSTLIATSAGVVTVGVIALLLLFYAVAALPDVH